MSRINEHEDEDRAIRDAFLRRERVARVRRASTRGAPYTVYFGGLHDTCSCPDFEYRRAAAGEECKHLSVLNQLLKEAEEGRPSAVKYITEHSQAARPELREPYEVREVARFKI